MNKNKSILHLGFLVPVIFWLTLLLSGRIYPEYNHLSNLVSELGALDAPSRWVFNLGLLMCALLSLVFSIRLVRACRRSGLSTLPAWLLTVHGLSMAAAAIFPLPLPMHARAGTLGMLLPLPLLAVLIFWRGGNACRLRRAAVISLVLMGLGFSVMFPQWLPQLAGLKQRFAHMGWSVMFIGLGTFPWKTGILSRHTPTN